MAGNDILAFPGKTEHVGDNVSRAATGSPDGFQHSYNAARLHESADGLHGDPGIFGGLPVGGQFGIGQAVVHDGGRLDHAGQGVVDLVGHARSQPAHREHLLALDHHLLQAHPFGHVVHPDHGALHAVGYQGEDGDVFVPDFLSQPAKNPGGTDHPAIADGAFDLYQFIGQMGKHFDQGP